MPKSIFLEVESDAGCASTQDRLPTIMSAEVVNRESPNSVSVVCWIMNWLSGVSLLQRAARVPSVVAFFERPVKEPPK
jgi:hypothetical protein